MWCGNCAFGGAQWYSEYPPAVSFEWNWVQLKVNAKPIVGRRSDEEIVHIQKCLHWRVGAPWVSLQSTNNKYSIHVSFVSVSECPWSIKACSAAAQNACIGNFALSSVHCQICPATCCCCRYCSSAWHIPRDPIQVASMGWDAIYDGWHSNTMQIGANLLLASVRLLAAARARSIQRNSFESYDGHYGTTAARTVKKQTHKKNGFWSFWSVIIGLIQTNLLFFGYEARCRPHLKSPSLMPVPLSLAGDRWIRYNLFTYTTHHSSICASCEWNKLYVWHIKCDSRLCRD